MKKELWKRGNEEKSEWYSVKLDLTLWNVGASARDALPIVPHQV